MTDALQTLGTTELGSTPGRDAIHLAVEPVIAGEALAPGQDIGIVNGKATSQCKKKLGIVDPFLKSPVFEGETFWLIVYPRQITSLRHVWEHPDFTPEALAKDLKVEEAREWIENFAANCIGISYAEIMQGAKEYAEDGEYISMGDNEDYSNHHDKMPEFWKHFKTLTGIDAVQLGKENDGFFSCSC